MLPDPLASALSGIIRRAATTPILRLASEHDAIVARAKCRAIGWPDDRLAVGCHRLRGGVTP